MVREPERPEQDIQASVAEYNRWYLRFSADAYRLAREGAMQLVERTFNTTNNLRDLDAPTLWRNPGIIRGLRMTSSPPWAVDRLTGISGSLPSLVDNMEKNATGKSSETTARPHIKAIVATVKNGYDHELLPWLNEERPPTADEFQRAFLTMADRLAISIANPAIRNEQESRQLTEIRAWLEEREYTNAPQAIYDEMAPGTYKVHMNVEGRRDNGNTIKIPVDIAIMPGGAQPGDRPVLMECKSAGDFTNVNKRRKEESDKHRNLTNRHGDEVRYVLYLSGYFDANYLQYERDAGIQCYWHHRIDDLGELGL